MTRSVLTWGTFDGVHRGHRAIVRRLLRLAHRHKTPAIALSFERPPRHFFNPPQGPDLITTQAEKAAFLRQLGVHRVRFFRFDQRMAMTSAEAFFHETLLRRYRARCIVVGNRMTFGKNRVGRLPLLKKWGHAAGIPVHVVKPVRFRGRPISSQQIRRLLRRGDIRTAQALLGRPYSVQGRVVRGAGRGQTLGFPTLNIKPLLEKILPPGVFVVRVNPGGRWGLCNVGTRPTFTPREKRLHLEVYLLEGRPLRLPRSLTVIFMKRIRAERRFPNARSLHHQIEQDIQFALQYRRNLIN